MTENGEMVISNLITTDLTHSVSVVVLLKTEVWVPEQSCGRSVPHNPQKLPLTKAICEGVDCAAGAVVHRDGGGLGGGGCLPSEDTHEVDTEIHRDKVEHTLSLDKGRPHYPTA